MSRVGESVELALSALAAIFSALSAYSNNFRQKILYFDVLQQKRVLFNCFATKQCLGMLKCEASLSQAFTGSLWLLLDLSLSLSGSLWFSVTLATTFEIEGMVYFCPKNKTGSQMDVSFQIGDLYTQ